MFEKIGIFIKKVHISLLYLILELKSVKWQALSYSSDQELQGSSVLIQGLSCVIFMNLSCSISFLLNLLSISYTLAKQLGIS